MLSQSDQKFLDDLYEQSLMFEMQVDYETLDLKPKTFRVEKPWQLQRWIEGRADKQMDHEFMNRDGDK